MEFSGKNIHIVGICGVSLSALAVLLSREGARVTGSDLDETEAARLRTLGITVFVGHRKENILSDTDMVVFSSAISDNNPELIEAKRRGLVLLSRAELLSEISKRYGCVIAVAGSHGKTTTTAMIASMLIDAGLNPTVHVGGWFSKIGGNVRVGSKAYFVTEACEYKNNFLKLCPDTAVILNVQADHLDFFKTFAGVVKGFFSFAQKIKHDGALIYNADDQNMNFPEGANAVGFSVENGGDINAANIKMQRNGTYSFDCIFDGSTLGRVHLSVCGEHNIKNALATILVGLHLGIDFKTIAKSVGAFCGVDRRFQLLGTMNGAAVYSDYAHHPTEIKASIKTAKSFTAGKILAVFQPHTYTRTAAFFDDFISSVADADERAFYSIFPARERPMSGITHTALAQKSCKLGLNARAIDDKNALFKLIAEFAAPNNTILLLGAGNMQNLCKELKFDEKYHK